VHNPQKEMGSVIRRGQAVSKFTQQLAAIWILPTIIGTIVRVVATGVIVLLLSSAFHSLNEVNTGEG
jgi:hypothetical protein